VQIVLEYKNPLRKNKNPKQKKIGTALSPTFARARQDLVQVQQQGA
jgi:hypothetical protein